MEKELLYKNRSFSSCINAAYKLQLENLRSILKCTWLPILVQSLLMGCYTVLIAPWIANGATMTAMPFTRILVLIGIALLEIVATAWTLSRLMSLLNEKPRRWNFRRSLWMMVANAIISLAFVALFSGGVGAALGYLQAKATSGEATPSMTTIMAILGIYILLLLLFFCLIQLPLLYASMRYLNDEKMHFWRDLLQSLRTGLRHWGFIFITVLLSSIFISIIIMLLMIPSFILSFASYASEVGVVTGDPSGIPNYFPWLQFITSVIVFFLVYQVALFEALVIYFMYGSIETQEKERLSAKTIPPIPDVTEETGIQTYPSSI